MVMDAPKRRGTKFPGFPRLPRLPDPSAPLDALLKGIEDLRDQGDRAAESADQLVHTVTEAAGSLQQAAKARLKASPFRGRQQPP